ncbi:MAG: YraN family protein [Bacillota bacterium]
MKTEKNNKRATGTLGEEIALDFLMKNKYRILEKNFRYKRLGEIDIISRENDYICFIEVKTRSTVEYGYPREAVSIRKQENIRRLAQIYINKHNLHDENIRFDIVEVYIEKKGDEIKVREVTVIKNAF